ncbi:MAG: peptidase S8 [candidate division WOR-3 bacterium]|nr:MAG: peptidase S8 [candidate division WOR-3 bacterium]
MTLLLLAALTLWPRPAYEPVRTEDAARVQELVRGFESRSVRRAQDAVRLRAEDVIPGRFVVGVEPGAADAAAAFAVCQGGTVVRDATEAGFIVVEFPAETDAAPLGQDFETLRGVRYFEPDCRVRICLFPNDPLFASHQWDKWLMYADKAWDVVSGTGVKAAVVDNGTDYYHPDLAANFNTAELGYDFISNDTDPRPDDLSIPQAFHGTHVAGTIGAVTDNNLGVAGWAQVQLQAVRVLDDSGNGNTSDVALGIRWAVDHGADIVSMSLGSQSAPTALVDACKYAEDRGVLLVAASGNEGDPDINYPARLSQCVAVGATDSLSRRASFSNYGRQLEVAAPGVRILSTAPSSQYGWSDGTSMAAPQVSGVAALVMAANPGLSAKQVRGILSAAAIDLGTSGFDQHTGYGLVNAGRAVELAGEVAAKLSSQPGPRVRVVGTEGFQVPEWAESAEVHDALGRTAASWQTGTDRLVRLKPGAWFVRLSGSGRTARMKVLVAR